MMEMKTPDAPVQGTPQTICEDWVALPSWLPVPGMGTIPVNAFLLNGPEPMLVDTGLAALSDAFVDALAEAVDVSRLRWIWLSHTDADHIGNLDRILRAAPEARVVTTFLGAGKMQMMGKGDPARLRVLEPGEILTVGGRKLLQVKPPYYDAPETMGFFDVTGRVLFAADSFGALLPGAVETIDDLTDGTLRDGLIAWSSIDAPWLTHLDRQAFGAILDSLERMEPAHVLSGHLPAAHDIGPLLGHLDAAYGRGAAGGGPLATGAPDGLAVA